VSLVHATGVSKDFEDPELRIGNRLQIDYKEKHVMSVFVSNLGCGWNRWNGTLEDQTPATRLVTYQAVLIRMQ
jgi:hypothetical protein